MTDRYQPLRDAIAGPIIRSPRIAVRAARSICVGDTRPVDTVEDLERGLHIEILGGENTEAEAQFIAAADPDTIRELLAERDQLAAEIEALRAEVERLNRILGRIVEGDGDSTLVIHVGTDAFAAAREYLRPNT